MARFPKIRYLLLALIVLAYLAYAWEYIRQTSFEIDGQRYYVLFDDAMISMRYAKNLAQGDGLVWNPGGERVEGYSNPLWVVWMTLLHFLPLPASQVSLAVQVSGAALMAVGLLFVQLVADELGAPAWVGLAAAALTAFYTPLHNWALQGMEVSALAPITLIAAWQALRVARSGRFSAGLYILLGAATLVRIDMAVVFAAVLAFLLLADAPNRKAHLLWGLGSLAVFMGGQTLWRLAYYGEALPNTYYLKVTGVPLWFRVAHGAYVFWQFVWSTNVLLYLLPVALLPAWRDWRAFFLVGVFLAFSAYSIYVGGDAWEHRGGANRFIAVAMPLFFVAFTYTVERLRAALAKDRPAWAGAALLLLALAGVGLSAYNFNTMLGANWLQRWTLRRQPLFVSGTERYTRMGLTLKQITAPGASIAVVTAGAIPYFAERTAIDLMGKNDATIARLPMRVEASLAEAPNFRPGHTKWDYGYSITGLKPDVVAQLWDETGPEAEPYLRGVYTHVIIDEIPYDLRIDSPYILWDQVQALQQPASP
jgi:hypothetical protein